MSTPTEPNSDDRELAALLHEVARDPSLLQMEYMGDDGRCRWSVSETGKRLLDLCHNIETHVAQRVAEAVGPLEKELAKADWMLAAVDLNRSGWAPSFIDEVTDRACKGPHKGPAELLVEACNTVDSTRKALTTAESDRDSLAALVVRLKDVLARIRKDIPTDFNARGLRGRFVDETGPDSPAGFYELDHDELLDGIIEKIDTALREAGRAGGE